MPFNLNDFRSIIGKRGLAKPSNFEVRITPPSGLSSDTITNDLQMFVDTANLPGVSFSTEGVMHKGYGLMEQRPSALQFEPLTITAIGDGEGKVLGFFQKWLALTYNFDAESESSTTGVLPETFNYPEEYWTTVELMLYDITSKQYELFQFLKCHPIALNAVTLGWEQNDTLMRIPITFTYRSYTSTALSATSSQATTINSDTQARTLERLARMREDSTIQEYQQRLADITRTV